MERSRHSGVLSGGVAVTFEGSSKEHGSFEFVAGIQAMSGAFPAEVSEKFGFSDSPAVTAEHTKERVPFFDVAKGIGILLVVLGHAIGGLHAAGMIGENSLLWFAFYLIYSFHMPLFFFLSGAFVESRIAANPEGFLKANLMRIAYPYLLWGVVQTATQLAFADSLNHPLTLPPSEQLISILWAPPAQFWFLYALFFLHLTALITFRAGGRAAFALVFALILAAGVASSTVASFISGYVSATDILFYVLGTCAGHAAIDQRTRVNQPIAFGLCAVIAFGSLVWLGWSQRLSLDTLATLPAAFAGTAMVLLLCQTAALRQSPWLAYVGRRALAIYVLHVLCVAGMRIVLMKATHVSSVALILPVIFAAGVAIPLVVDRAVRAVRASAVLGLP